MAQTDFEIITEMKFLINLANPDLERFYQLASSIQLNHLDLNDILLFIINKEEPNYYLLIILAQTQDKFQDNINVLTTNPVDAAANLVNDEWDAFAKTAITLLLLGNDWRGYSLQQQAEPQPQDYTPDININRFDVYNTDDEEQRKLGENRVRVEYFLQSPNGYIESLIHELIIFIVKNDYDQLVMLLSKFQFTSKAELSTKEAIEALHALDDPQKPEVAELRIAASTVEEKNDMPNNNNALISDRLAAVNAMLLKREDSCHPFGMFATGRNHLASQRKPIRVLTQRKNNYFQQFASGGVPILLYAVQHKAESCLSALVAVGCDPNQIYTSEDNENFTAYSKAHEFLTTLDERDDPSLYQLALNMVHFLESVTEVDLTRELNLASCHSRPYNLNP